MSGHEIGDSSLPERQDTKMPTKRDLEQRADPTVKEGSPLHRIHILTQERDHLAQEVAIARTYMWLGHGCNGHGRYGDDGEMQCCGMDFKRMAVAELDRRCQELAMIRLANSSLAVDPPSTESPS